MGHQNYTAYKLLTQDNDNIALNGDIRITLIWWLFPT